VRVIPDERYKFASFGLLPANSSEIGLVVPYQLTSTPSLTNGVNMTQLETYLEDGTFTATLFYAEVDGRPDSMALIRALDELRFI
jgi:hypothetical protein